MEKTNYFNDSFYDIIIKKAEELFPKKVTVDLTTNRIIIKDRITVVFQCAMTENRVFVATFINVEGEKEFSIKVWDSLIDLNSCFFLDDLFVIVGYLTFKSKENDFVNTIA